jgi:hypothetical protein
MSFVDGGYGTAPLAGTTASAGLVKKNGGSRPRTPFRVR